jgi:tetratricopeptide (TPR) repeat protein
MASLVPTLHAHLQRADRLLADGRASQARQAFESLLSLAQERSDRAMEVLVRSTLARLALQRHAVDEARDLLAAAARLLDPHHQASHRRYRAALARLAVAEGPAAVARTEVEAYLRWAEGEGMAGEVMDAALLLVPLVSANDAVSWLQRAIDHGLAADASERLGEAHVVLAGVLEGLGELGEALSAYASALHWHQVHGRPRDVVAAGWAVGSLAARLDDEPRARDALHEARQVAATADDCDDLLALVLADLASVEAAAGDVVEARRLVLEALRLARDAQLPALWPARWSALQAQARGLEIL